MIAESDDLDDLIERERDINWQRVKPKIPLMPTEELVELMMDLGLYVNKTLALEIAQREDAVFWLKKVVQHGGNWYQGTRGDAWPPLHTIHILPLIKTEEALELLLDVARYKNWELREWLTEDVPSILVAFGESITKRLKEFAQDETLEAFARGTAASALVVFARKNPELENEVKNLLIELLNTTHDPTFAALVSMDLLSIGDSSVIPVIKKALKEDRIKSLFIRDIHDKLETSMFYDEPDRHTKDPLNHFSRKNIEGLHSINYPEQEEPPRQEKVGRNDPCPCGSGKKYKKCCLGKNEE